MKFTNLIQHTNRFIRNNQRKNLKYAATPLPKWPSISFILEYHISQLEKTSRIAK